MWFLNNLNYTGENIIKLTDRKLKKDSIILEEYSSEQGFPFIKKEHEILGNFEEGEGKANFIKINHGKGHLYLHSEPIFLTNFYLLYIFIIICYNSAINKLLLI